MERRLSAALLGLALIAFVSAARAADNFTPGETILIASVTTTSSSATFALPQSANYPDVMVCNTGSVIMYGGCGNGGVANTPAAGAVNATPLLALSCSIFYKGAASTCSAITPSGSTSATFTAGQGE